jgi:hypothetical protein
MMKLNRVMKRLFSHCMSDYDIECFGLTVDEKLGSDNYDEMHLHLSPERANFVYATTQIMPNKPFGSTSCMIKSQANSCMRYATDEKDVIHHPSEAYATGDFIVAYLSNSPDPLAKDAKTFARCYIGIQRQEKGSFVRAAYRGDNYKTIAPKLHKADVVYTVCPVYCYQAAVAVPFLKRIKEALGATPDNPVVAITPALGDHNLAGAELDITSGYANGMGLVGLTMHRMYRNSARRQYIFPYVDQHMYLRPHPDNSDLFVLHHEETVATNPSRLADVDNDTKTRVTDRIRLTVSSHMYGNDPAGFDSINTAEWVNNMIRMYGDAKMDSIMRLRPARFSGGAFVGDVANLEPSLQSQYTVAFPPATPSAYQLCKTEAELLELPSTYNSMVRYTQADVDAGLIESVSRLNATWIRNANNYANEIRVSLEPGAGIESAMTNVGVEFAKGNNDQTVTLSSVITETRSETVAKFSAIQVADMRSPDPDDHRVKTLRTADINELWVNDSCFQRLTHRSKTLINLDKAEQLLLSNRYNALQEWRSLHNIPQPDVQQVDLTDIYTNPNILICLSKRGRGVSHYIRMLASEWTRFTQIFPQVVMKRLIKI